MTITLDFPIKTQWIHDVLNLWQPEQPISALVEAAVRQTMQELGGEETRRKTFVIIARYFVPTTGESRSRRTTTDNVWAAYSRAFPASTLAPAYLAELIAQNEIAQTTTRFIASRYSPGDVFSTSEIRRPIISHYGERKVLLNSATAFLRTLQNFGVMAKGPQRGEYRYAGRLSVPQEVFPLLVWSWWQIQPQPYIDPDEFAAQPAFALVDTEPFLDHWHAYGGKLWSVEERLEGRRVVMKWIDSAGMINDLLRLV